MESVTSTRAPCDRAKSNIDPGPTEGAWQPSDGPFLTQVESQDVRSRQHTALTYRLFSTAEPPVDAGMYQRLHHRNLHAPGRGERCRRLGKAELWGW